MDKQLKEFLKQLKENESVISLLLGALVVVIVGVLLFNYYQQSQSQPQITETSEATTSGQYQLSYQTNEQGQQVPEQLPLTYTVKPGDNLWKIAETYYGSGYNWVDIVSENKLQTPNLLANGEQLVLPKVRVRVPLNTGTNQQSTNTAQITPTPTVHQISGNTYQVQKGDSLWSIAVEAYNDGYAWTKIYQANADQIKTPGVIEPGWTLTIPRN